MTKVNDLIAFAVNAYGKTEDEVTELLTEKSGDEITLKPDASKILLDLDAAKVGGLKKSGKDELTKMHEQGYNKAKAETLSAFEKSFKDATGFQSDKQGIDLILSWGESLKKQTGVEDVKSHPDYLKLEKRLQTEFVPKSDYDKLMEDFTGFKAGEQKAKTMSVVKQDALRYFRSLNPVIDEDPVVATNREADFLDKLAAFEYEVDANGEHLVKKDGQKLETPNGLTLAFTDHVKSVAQKYFTFRAQSEKGNAGAGRNVGGGNAGDGVQHINPKDVAEYNVMIANATNPAERVRLYEYYKQHLVK